MRLKAISEREGNTMKISVIAIIFLSLYVGLGQLDALSLKTGLYSPVFGGAVTGLVLGDLKTGLIVGATLQLATLKDQLFNLDHHKRSLFSRLRKIIINQFYFI